MTVRFGHFVTLNMPLKPIKFWHRGIKGWHTIPDVNCSYSTRVGAAIAAGKKKSDYSESELRDFIATDYLIIK